MAPTYNVHGAFMSDSDGGPRKDRALDWYAWHFTHVDNLPSIVAAGCLHCDNAAPTVKNVGLHRIKAKRRSVVVRPDAAYPAGRTVADHVPFYLAAKSPMQYAVMKGHDDYAGGNDDLVYFGVRLGEVESQGLTWCVSDRNAADGLVKFSRVSDSLGDFVDFDLLHAKMWNNTADDPDRAARRAAEVLVLSEVPLTMVSVVVAKNEGVLAAAQAAFAGVPGSRIFHVIADFYYQDWRARP